MQKTLVKRTEKKTAELQNNIQRVLVLKCVDVHQSEHRLSYLYNTKKHLSKYIDLIRDCSER